MRTTLQQDIHQHEPLANQEAVVLRSVLRTAAMVEHAIDEILKPYGITRTQYNVLRILQASGRVGLCGREIGERLTCPVPDMPRLLERMAEAGLICRERDPADRRLVTTQLTNVGYHLLVTVTPVLEERMQQWVGQLSDDQARTLIESLDAVRAAL